MAGKKKSGTRLWVRVVCVALAFLMVGSVVFSLVELL